MTNEEIAWMFIGLSTFYTLTLSIYFTYLLFYLFIGMGRKIENLEEKLAKINHITMNTDGNFPMSDKEKQRIETSFQQKLNEGS